MNKGYTLIELLIAMAMSLFTTLIVSKFFVTEHAIYTVQEAGAEMHQTLRGAMEMLSGELILAGYGLPAGMKGITRFDREEIEFRANLRNVTSFLTSAASPGQNTLYVREGTGRPFERGDVIILCKDLSDGGCEEHILLEDGRSDSIVITTALSSEFQAGSRIDLLNTISYRYNQSKKELQRKIDRGYWEPVAEHVVEDGFSLTYRDRNNNTPVDSSGIHSIDITLIVESFRRDIHFPDHNGFRRKSATATITLRN